MASSALCRGSKTVEVGSVITGIAVEFVGAQKASTDIARHHAGVVGALVRATLGWSIAGVTQNPWRVTIEHADVAEGGGRFAGHSIATCIAAQITCFAAIAIVGVVTQGNADVRDTLAVGSADSSYGYNRAVRVGQFAILSTGSVRATRSAVWIVRTTDFATDAIQGTARIVFLDPGEYEILREFLYVGIAIGGEALGSASKRVNACNYFLAINGEKGGTTRVTETHRDLGGATDDDVALGARNADSASAFLSVCCTRFSVVDTKADMAIGLCDMFGNRRNVECLRNVRVGMWEVHHQHADVVAVGQVSGPHWVLLFCSYRESLAGPAGVSTEEYPRIGIVAQIVDTVSSG